MVGQSDRGFNNLLFILTFSTSFLAVGVGEVKCLKFGVARIMGEGGSLDGLLTGKFTLSLISCLAGGAFKLGLWIYITFEYNKLGQIFGYVLTGFFILLTFVTTIQVTNIKSLKIIFTQPHLLLLPMFTFFSFQKENILSFRRSNIRVKISPNLSISNIIIHGIILVHIIDLGIYLSPGFVSVSTLVLAIVLPLYIIATLVTLSTLYFHKIFSCCCSCWNSPEDYVGVFDPEQPDKQFKLENGEVVEVNDNTEANSQLTEVNSSLEEKPEDMETTGRIDIEKNRQNLFCPIQMSLKWRIEIMKMANRRK